MLNFLENILSLLKDYTAADESSLLYFDGYSLINLKTTDHNKVLPEILISVNELLHIVSEEDSGMTVSSSLKNQFAEKNNFIVHYQEIRLSENDRKFYLLLSYSKEEKEVVLPDFLKTFFKLQIKEIGKLLVNYRSDHKVLASLKLLEMGNWRHFLKELNEISGDIVFIIDNEGNFLSINSYGAELLDYSPEEITGMHLTDILDSDNINYTNSEISKIIEIRGEGRFEATFLTRFEKKVYVELNVKTLISESRIMGLLGVGRNITIIRQLESKLKDLEPRLIEAERLIFVERARSNQHKALLDELNRLKSEFVSNISHELRTPLASIVGFSETINSDPKMSDELRLEFNSIILNEGKRLAKLINDVLDLSRIEAGVLALNKSTFDIVELAKSVSNEYKKLAERKGIVFNQEILSDKIMIEADKERISQTLQALLDNAVKFTKANGRIRIIISNLYREVEIIITDTGVGIPAKDLPFIFQKFHKVNRSDTETISTGIGLVFVKQIVDLHKGLITIQSEPDKGTSVILKLLKNIKERKN
jgi:PAS domain S-box-containing protein